MSETTTAAANTATKAAKKASEGLTDLVTDNSIPLVVEATELALEVPVRVVLNQKLVVSLSVLGGTALGAGILFGVQKLQARRLAKKHEAELEELTETEKV
jgi:hypothetical protein